MNPAFPKQVVIVVIVILVAIGGVTFFVLHKNPSAPVVPPVINPITGTSTNPGESSALTPTVTLTIEKSGNGNSLLVQWENLPSDTTGLNIFRSDKNGSNPALWKSISISQDELASGNAMIDIGTSDLSNYSFYFEAVSGGSGNNGGNGGNGSSTEILWTSPFTEPTNPTSTPGQSGNGGGGNSPNPASSSSSSTNNGPSNPTSTQNPPPSQGSGNNNSSTPTGTPYYNPQVQVEAYGSGQTGNFWVQHVDQKIQIGWQDLPATTDNIIIFRSENEDGPWDNVLTEENPGVTGSYSIQVVDDTLGAPYYYEMTAFAGTTTLATYGPVYLPPADE